MRTGLAIDAVAARFFHRTNAVPWLRSRRSYDARLFFLLDSAKSMICRKSMAVAMTSLDPGGKRGVHAFNLAGCMRSIGLAFEAHLPG